jgi:DNA-binding transcriptional LysR family regulator
MDLPQIKYFLAVCQVRSFTRAATICGISQPSLSVAIRRLEEELGGPLFDRGPPVLLLPRGEAIRPHFKAILREVDKIRRLGTGVTESATLFPNGQKRRFALHDAQPVAKAASREALDLYDGIVPRFLGTKSPT